MTTLVTGATGFVGSAVVRALLGRERSVRVLVRPSSERANIAGLPVEVVEGDLREPASLARALAGARALYHVAADYRLWARHPEEIYRSNVEGTRDLIRAALDAGVERIVYTSSVATLGLRPDGEPADEATPVTLEEITGHYKRSKFLAEAEVRRLVAEERAPVVIVNPSAPVGPRDIKPTPTGRLVLEAAGGKMPAYVETGLNLVHVDDVAEGHLLAFESGTIGERYILGGENLALIEILRRIASLVGRRPPRLRLPHALVIPIAHVAEAIARLGGGEPFVAVDGVRLARKRMYFTAAKAERTLGYRSRPVDEALADAVAWYRETGALS